MAPALPTSLKRMGTWVARGPHQTAVEHIYIICIIYHRSYLSTPTARVMMHAALLQGNNDPVWLGLALLMQKHRESSIADVAILSIGTGSTYGV